MSERTLPPLSFEFFPPKSPAASAALWAAVERLAPLAPDFVSVTYGAGGTTRDRTMAAILAIREHAKLNVAGHLTCVGASKAEVLRVASAYGKLGCRSIVALRGDPPPKSGGFQPHPEGFESSVELVEALAELEQFDLWVGAYPEKHPEARTHADDVAHLKRKVDAGACGAITQFFFENDTYYRFRDTCVKAGIDVPIVPGIMPVENFGKLCNFAKMCEAGIPDWMHKAYGNAETEEDHDLLSISIATEQCDDLIRNGAERIHLYTMNKPHLPWSVSRALGYEAHPVEVTLSSAG